MCNILHQLKSGLHLFMSPFSWYLQEFLLLEKKQLVGGGKKMINKLLRPYLTFSVIAILCYFLYEGILGGFSEGIASLTTNL